MEQPKIFSLQLTQVDLDIVAILIDIALKQKGLEVLDQITTLKSHIQQTIQEVLPPNQNVNE
jgi:hypothetical protein